MYLFSPFLSTWILFLFLFSSLHVLFSRCLLFARRTSDDRCRQRKTSNKTTTLRKISRASLSVCLDRPGVDPRGVLPLWSKDHFKSVLFCFLSHNRSGSRLGLLCLAPRTAIFTPQINKHFTKNGEKRLKFESGEICSTLSSNFEIGIFW